MYRKFEKLEKDFAAATSSTEPSPLLTKSTQLLDVVKKTAKALDSEDTSASTETAKAGKAIAAGDNVGAMKAIKACDTSIKKFEKLMKNLSAIPPILAKVMASDKTMKETDPDLYRGLKVLSTDVAAFESYCKYVHKDRKEGLINVGKTLTRSDRVKGVTDKALLQLDKAVKRANSSIQKIKAKPTVATWNKEFAYAGRDVKMAMVSLRKAMEGGDFTKWDPTVTEKYYKSICDWDTQKKEIKMKDDATEKEILAQLKKFSFLIKNMSRHYKIA